MLTLDSVDKKHIEYETLGELIEAIGIIGDDWDIPIKDPSAPDIEVTLEITNECIFGCSFCSTNSVMYPDGVSIPLPKLITFVHFIANKYNIICINISGGEPLLHPEIGHIIVQCMSYVEHSKIWLYSNLIKNLIFNAHVLEEFGALHANVCIGAGLDVHIPSNKIDLIHLLKLVPHGRAKEWKEIPMKVSGNFEVSEHDCTTCRHILLQADGKIVGAPCKKAYGEVE